MFSEIVKTMLNFYHWLFCSYYKWSLRVNPKDYYHLYQTVLMMSFVFIVNFTTLLIALESLFELSSHKAYPNSIGYFKVITAVIFIFISQYLYFSRKDRYLRLLKTYDNLNRGEENRMFIKSLGFALLSIVFLIYSWT
ncbi:hypothetical protein BM523_17910 [Alteromonas mediterranea]|nr:hypothetical protein BM523_17910 [Alteromonas mediterranea]APD99353.1 hypothetical protein BM525_17935 [Alteromonas mediterranea]